MERFEIDGVAVATYERAGFDPSKPVDPTRLALNLPGFDVEFATDMKRPAQLVPGSDGRWLIRIRQNATPKQRRWLAGHELGESIIADARIVSPYVEQYADNFGAALCLPRPAMHALRYTLGENFAAIAMHTKLTETIVALRFGEVFDAAVAIIMPGRVKRIGEMPPDHELRKIARAGGCRGVRAIRFTDSNRVALISQD
jgi:hypothetical protein